MGAKLKNKAIFDFIMENSKFNKLVAYIATGNTYKLKKASLSDLSAIEVFHAALRYGDMDAIKILIDAGVKIPTDDSSVKHYLRILFAELGEITKYDDKANSYNKKPDNLLAILNYMQNNVAPSNPMWSSKGVMDQVVPESVIGKESTMLEALLATNLVDNVNVPDSKGHTALYYLYTKHNNPALIESLKQRGAVLSAADELGLKQIQFSKDLLEAFKYQNTTAINHNMNEFKHNPELLTNGQLKDCLDAAIIHGDTTHVEVFLIAFKERNELVYDYPSVMTPDMAYFIATHAVSADKLVFDPFESTIAALFHRIGLSGTFVSAREVVSGREGKVLKVEGMDAYSSMYLLRNVLADYAKQHPDFIKIHESVEFTANVISIAGWNNALASQLHTRRYLEGHTQILAPHLFLHGLGAVLKYDANTNTTYFAISNRGDQGLEACIPDALKHLLKTLPAVGKMHFGTVVLSLEGQVDKSFFDEITSYSKDPMFDGPEHFKAFIEKHMANAKVVALLPAEAQKYGTCSYVNKKRSIEGFDVIESICRGEPVTKEKLDAVYNTYKEFSVDDKAKAGQALVSFYKSYTTQDKVDPVKADLLNQVIVAVILAHHSGKNNEVELKMAKELYKILPDPQKEKIVKLIPALASPHSTSASTWLFSANRQRLKDIPILGNPGHVLARVEEINKLLSFLKENHLNSSKIKRITVEGDLVKITTIENRDEKKKIRVDIFEKQLGAANVINVEGKYEFEVKLDAFKPQIVIKPT